MDPLQLASGPAPHACDQVVGLGLLFLFDAGLDEAVDEAVHGPGDEAIHDPCAKQDHHDLERTLDQPTHDLGYCFTVRRVEHPLTDEARFDATGVCEGLGQHIRHVETSGEAR